MTHHRPRPPRWRKLATLIGTTALTLGMVTVSTPPAQAEDEITTATYADQCSGDETDDYLYVSADATDSEADGTKDSPFATIQAAIDRAIADDTICVAAGSYKIDLSEAGADGQVILDKDNLRLIGANAGTNPNIEERGPETIVTTENKLAKSSYRTQSGVLIGSGEKNQTNTSGVEINGFTFVGGGIDTDSVQDEVTIYNNIFRNLRADGSDQPAIRSWHIGGGQQENHATNWRVENNRISNWDVGESSGIFLNNTEGATVSGNMISDTGYGAIIVSQSKDTTISGNTISNSLVRGINVASQGGSLTIEGNDIRDASTWGHKANGAIRIYAISKENVGIKINDNFVEGPLAALAIGEGTFDPSTQLTAHDNTFITTGNYETVVNHRASSKGETFSIDARYNYWGDAYPDFDKTISGDVDTTAWYTTDDKNEIAVAAGGEVQDALNHASSNDTVRLLGESYKLEKALEIDKAIILIGSNPNTESHATLTAAQNKAAIDITTDVDDEITVKDLTLNAPEDRGTTSFGINFKNSGETVNTKLALESVSIEGFVYGVNIAHTGSNFPTFSAVHIVNSTIDGNNVGLRVSSHAAIDELVIENSAFSNNIEGVSVAVEEKEADKDRTNQMGTIRIEDSSFVENQRKGIYLTSGRDIVFDNLIVDGSGVDEDYRFNTGVDLNLYFGTIDGITIRNSSVLNSGQRSTGDSSEFGPSISIATRADKEFGIAPRVENVTVENSQIKGAQIGIALSGTVDEATVTGNRFIDGSNFAVANGLAVEVDATKNYWGEEPEFSKLISTGPSSPVRYAPWYADEGMTQLQYAVPVDQQPTVTVPDEYSDEVHAIDAHVDFSDLLGDDSNTVTVPSVTTMTGTRAAARAATVTIKSDTTITPDGEDWDGVLSAPTVVDVPGVVPGSSADAVAISFGSNVLSFTFDKPVKIVLDGQANKRAGWIDIDGRFHPITLQCVDEGLISHQLVGHNGECWTTEDSNLVIWTTHFTTFVAYTIRSGGSPATPEPVKPRFIDVPASHQFFDDVEWLANTGVTKGYTDGGFHPVEPVTRQAMAAFLYRLQNPGKTDPACSARAFKDVPKADQFCGVIAWLAKSGVTKGYTDGGFQPAEPVTRQAMAAFLYRLQNPGKADPACTASAFGDVPKADQFCGVIAWLADTGVTKGYTDGGFHPVEPVTRQAMAAFLHRMQGVA